jgi:hypothetical protein
VTQFGTKIDAKYFQKIQQQIRQTYAGQTQQQTATSGPQSVEELLRSVDPSNWQPDCSRSNRN